MDRRSWKTSGKVSNIYFAMSVRIVSKQSTVYHIPSLCFSPFFSKPPPPPHHHNHTHTPSMWCVFPMRSVRCIDCYVALSLYTARLIYTPPPPPSPPPFPRHTPRPKGPVINYREGGYKTVGWGGQV